MAGDSAARDTRTDSSATIAHRLPEGAPEPRFELAVVVATDLHYQWPALLALVSAAVHCSASTICVLIGDRLEEGFVVAARETCDRLGVPFQYVPADFDEYESLPAGFHFSRAIYGRLRAVEATRQHSPRTLYLDADTLVVGDISSLARMDLHSHIVAAVRAHGIPTCGSPGGVLNWKERGIDPSAPFFNSGVLLIDNDAWERNGISTRVLADLGGEPNAAFPDQSALNAVLYLRWIELGKQWNREIVRTPSLRVGPLVLSMRSLLFLPRLRILHYFQSVKPWQSRYPPGYLTILYRRNWRRLLPVPAPVTQNYRQWLRNRY